MQQIVETGNYDRQVVAGGTVGHIGISIPYVTAGLYRPFFLSPGSPGLENFDSG